jgi:ferredoxin-nitrite reductase
VKARQSADSFASIEIAGDTCPGLFYQTAAQDGFLTRIRVPGGGLSHTQAEYLAEVAQQSGNGQIWLTNRANVQLRLDAPQIAPEVLVSLQQLGLAATCAEVDHLRNLMASPTAGIDPLALIDSRPLVAALDRYFSTHPELAPLSAKFSIGLDGGESLSIRDRRNDICFVAESSQQLRLLFGMGGEWLDTGMVCALNQVVDLVGAMSQIYLATAPDIPPEVSAHRRSRKPRWRQVVKYLGLNVLRDYLSTYAVTSTPQADESTVRGPMPNHYDRYVGLHPQSQPNQFYAGVVVPLGRLQATQLQRLGQLATTYGSGELRLTPWQNVLIPNIAQTHLGDFQRDLDQFSLTCDVAHPASAIVACSGLPGCGSSLTDTQVDATQIIQHLMHTILLDQPLNIHVSGCAKGCAQPDGSDIALMGQVEASGAVGYAIYVRSAQETFGRSLGASIQPIQVPRVVEQMVRAYQRSRLSDQESFSAFTQRQTIAQLQALFGFAGGVG